MSPRIWAQSGPKFQQRFISFEPIMVIMELITIPKHEYQRLKKLEELDFDLIRQFANSLEDLRKGRFKRLA